jgi:DNA-binding transcriptional MerR regulator
MNLIARSQRDTPEEEGVSPSKSPEAFRTISEVASDLDVPQHVLRFWETRFSQIRPMKRGGGRRYYRPADVDLLKGVRRLLYGEGYTIRGVQRILKESGTAYVVDIGRGEVRAQAPEVASNEPKSIAIAPRRPRVVMSSASEARSSSAAKPPLVGSSQPAPRVPLSKEQLTGLRDALSDLVAARRFLASRDNS